MRPSDARVGSVNDRRDVAGELRVGEAGLGEVGEIKWRLGAKVDPNYTQNTHLL